MCRLQALVLPENREWDGVELGKDSGAFLFKAAAAIIHSTWHPS